MTKLSVAHINVTRLEQKVSEITQRNAELIAELVGIRNTANAFFSNVICIIKGICLFGVI